MARASSAPRWMMALAFIGALTLTGAAVRLVLMGVTRDT